MESLFIMYKSKKKKYSYDWFCGPRSQMCLCDAVFSPTKKIERYGALEKAYFILIGQWW